MKAMIKFYWMWLVYLWAVQDDKFLHSMAQIKGMRAVSYRKYGLSGFEIQYDPNYPPQSRSWLTWAEYKERWHPKTGTKVKEKQDVKQRERFVG